MTSELRVKSDSFLLGRKRSDIDIIANILVEADKGTKKTHILYRCNMSHRQLQVYLQFLYDLGFLVSYANNDGSKLKCFRTTSKGLDFLDAYRILKSLMS
jgi:predicted transcriptional regulator